MFTRLTPTRWEEKIEAPALKEAGYEKFIILREVDHTYCVCIQRTSGWDTVIAEGVESYVVAEQLAKDYRLIMEDDAALWRKIKFFGLILGASVAFWLASKIVLNL